MLDLDTAIQNHISKRFLVTLPKQMRDGYLYRFHDSAVYMTNNELLIEVFAEEYKIISKTPKGCWVEAHDKEKRFVLDQARKKYAYPDLESAYDSYMHRKYSQQAILKAQMLRCNEVVSQEDVIKGHIDRAIEDWHKQRRDELTALISPKEKAA